MSNQTPRRPFDDFMRKKLSLTLIVLLTAAVVLCGCSSVQPVSEGATAKDSSETATAQEALNDAAKDSSQTKSDDAADDSSEDVESEWVSLQSSNNEAEVSAASSNTVHVKTAKEFLAAIAPDTQIVLEKGKKLFEGEIEEAIAFYEERNAQA